MKGIAYWLATGLLVACAAVVPAAAQEGKWTYDDGLRFVRKDVRVNITNRVQGRFTLTEFDSVESSDRDSKGSFDITRYKLTIDGALAPRWSFGVQANLADGSEASTKLLEDAFLQYRYGKSNLAQVWMGQGKVAFGRQELTSSGNLQFVDRSIASERFAQGRDVGIALTGHNGNRTQARESTYSYSIGIYNGNGINKDEGDNIDYMYAGRLMFTPLGTYQLSETDVPGPAGWGPPATPDKQWRSRFAVGVSAILNTIGTEGVEEERASKGGLEIAYKLMSIGPDGDARGLNLVAEFFTESADILLPDPSRDEVDTDGWYLQGGYLFGNGLEIAGRYSEILVPDTPNADSTETGVAFGYYFDGHGYKIQADYRVLEFEATGDEQFIDRDVFRVQLQRVF